MSMKERPILFSALAVRAILAGAKTQTRRVVRPQPEPDEEMRTLALKDGVPYMWLAKPVGETIARERRQAQTCPYGEPGDRLWVRETWKPHPDPANNHQTAYAATDKGCWPSLRWRPSIHMPRWASRIDLEVTGVRVERLQNISEADAAAEGVQQAPQPMATMYSAQEVLRTRYRQGFADLWESIHGPGSWDANPWVWVVEFRRIEKTGAA